jgi:uncharacterized protein (DUF305 family)
VATPRASLSAPQPGPGQISEEHNDADIAFAEMMIVHHHQAIAMADLAADRAASEAVKSLAEQIRAAQGPEIETMTGLLHAWDAEVLEGVSPGGTGGTGGTGGPGRMGGMHGMPGAMAPEQMDQLMGAQGAGFDRMFLEMMTSHHNGAVEMARTEQAQGQNPQALELAETIEKDQTAEVERMRQILTSL